MLPRYVYNLIVDVTGYKNTWVIEATEDEIKKLANSIRNSVVHPEVEYEFNTDPFYETTHMLDNKGNLWNKTGININ